VEADQEAPLQTGRPAYTSKPTGVKSEGFDEGGHWLTVSEKQLRLWNEKRQWNPGYFSPTRRRRAKIRNIWVVLGLNNTK